MSFFEMIIKKLNWRRRQIYETVSPLAKLIDNQRIEIGCGTKVGDFATIWADGEFIKIGENCTIHPYAYLRLHGGSITIGHHVFINPFSVLYGHGGLKIGNDVLIASHVTIIPSNHNFENDLALIRQQGETKRGIVIEDDVWIGTGAKILDGVTLAKGCVIGAGAVVTKSTLPYGVYVGVPARLVKYRGKHDKEINVSEN